jgi:hypothetical protein
VTTAPDNTGEKQVVRGRFKKGRSGNAKGRPRGSLNRATLAAQQLFEGEAEAVARKAVEMALAGDGAAMRLVLERLVPPRRSPCVSLDLGPTDDAQGVSEAQGRLLAAVSDGEIAVDEALKVGQLLEGRRAAIETADLVEEIEAIRGHFGSER